VHIMGAVATRSLRRTHVRRDDNVRLEIPVAISLSSLHTQFLLATIRLLNLRNLAVPAFVSETSVIGSDMQY